MMSSIFVKTNEFRGGKESTTGLESLLTSKIELSWKRVRESDRVAWMEEEEGAKPEKDGARISIAAAFRPFSVSMEGNSTLVGESPGILKRELTGPT